MKLNNHLKDKVNLVLQMNNNIIMYFQEKLQRLTHNETYSNLYLFYTHKIILYIISFHYLLVCDVYILC